MTAGQCSLVLAALCLAAVVIGLVIGSREDPDGGDGGDGQEK